MHKEVDKINLYFTSTTVALGCDWNNEDITNVDDY